ncbi:hypothetical protein MSLAZ_0848 [Methanosarcina lacustris Z-7289]|uniref:SWIM-type domain-containing protein n=1 Tax=Methanosarcina lacustris Z-7289 TaxID=1434111 RepID=A0A0E3S0F5_9EURY|nr:SWIM zinc finger family protein [Methanosarcina lacustris]AKB74109.1 hypothetical protein MSLAZ_0848 [Methanosarcina lacustris Z-7289]
MAAYWDNYGHYEPTKPIEVKGGIKAKSKRGGFAQSWWAKRWIKTLENFNIGARLTRGKSYARKGQVTSIKIETGLVKAKVQGSSPKPYSVTIKVRTLNGSEWDLLAEKLSLKPIFAAKLLAGEMPEDIEAVFEDSGISLFPEKLDDLETDCSCPDWSNPCKHIAAVYYLLGEEFDRDPFLIFKLRGVDMDDFMSLLGRGPDLESGEQASESGIFIKKPDDEIETETGAKARTGAKTKAKAGAKTKAGVKAKAKAGTGAEAEIGTGARTDGGTGTVAETGGEIKTVAEAGTRTEAETSPFSPAPLPLEPEAFWGRSPESPEEVKGPSLKAHIPPVPAALPKRLGKFPFWRGEEDLLEVLEEIYSKASPAGMRVFLGERK